MTTVKLRIHVTEPWDFERIAGTAELTGRTDDAANPDAQQWEVQLDEGFDYHGRFVDQLLASPRYVGEPLSRTFDAVTGFPVRLALLQDDAITGEATWHYAFIGMISPRPEDEDGRDDEQDNGASI